MIHGPLNTTCTFGQLNASLHFSRKPPQSHEASFWLAISCCGGCSWHLVNRKLLLGGWNWLCLLVFTFLLWFSSFPTEERLGGAQSICPQLGLLGWAGGVGAPLLGLLLLALWLATATTMTATAARALGCWWPLNGARIWIARVRGHSRSWATQSLCAHG